MQNIVSRWKKLTLVETQKIAMDVNTGNLGTVFFCMCFMPSIIVIVEKVNGFMRHCIQRKHDQKGECKVVCNALVHFFCAPKLERNLKHRVTAYHFVMTKRNELALPF